MFETANQFFVGVTYQIDWWKTGTVIFTLYFIGCILAKAVWHHFRGDSSHLFPLWPLAGAAILILAALAIPYCLAEGIGNLINEVILNPVSVKFAARAQKRDKKKKARAQKRDKKKKELEEKKYADRGEGYNGKY